MKADGSVVFGGGTVRRADGSLDYAVFALDAASGDTIWIARYDGAGHDDDMAMFSLVSPDGESLFVTGRSPGAGTSMDYATIAFDTRRR